jgi:hypothetical protein
MIYTMTGVRNMPNFLPGYADLARRRGWDINRAQGGSGKFLTIAEFAQKTGYSAAVIQHLIATRAVDTVVLDGVTHIVSTE